MSFEGEKQIERLKNINGSLRFLAQDHKILAIKMCRAFFGAGLREAKDYIEELVSSESSILKNTPKVIMDQFREGFESIGISHPNWKDEQREEDDVRKELSKAVDRIEELSKDFKKASDENDSFMARNSELERACAKLEELNGKLHKKTEQLNNHVRQLQSDYNTLSGVFERESKKYDKAIEDKDAVIRYLESKLGILGIKEKQ